MAIAFIGGGNMATALIGGMLARGGAVDEFRVVEPLAEARARIAARFPGLALFGESAHDAVAGAALVVLAVKPQQMRQAANALAPHLAGADAPVVLSIAAGIRLADLGRWLHGHARLVRAMPNTPALVGKGISGAFAAASVDAAGRALVSSVLAAAGEQVWVADESMLDAVTGVSGSGPAYVFYFLEALEAAARDLGFAAPMRANSRMRRFRGRSRWPRHVRLEPATLRARVTSKGGTTERALASMEADAVKASIVAAVKAAALRAGELGDASAGTSDDVRPGPPFSGRYRVRDRHLRLPAALHDAMAARAVPQSPRAGGGRPHGLGSQARSPRGPGLQGLDGSTLLLAWVAECAWLVTLELLAGRGAFDGAMAITLALLACVELVKATLWLLIISSSRRPFCPGPRPTVPSPACSTR